MFLGVSLFGAVENAERGAVPNLQSAVARHRAMTRRPLRIGRWPSIHCPATSHAGGRSRFLCLSRTPLPARPVPHRAHEKGALQGFKLRQQGSNLRQEGVAQYRGYLILAAAS